ncbi:hypothetical protein GCM10023084_39800 [Streptomyces lacrimifluminis]|uniref:Uncharacterized protein n=1 Tax=Streptomyces lacrimifluminis TaxID=1500077 RepID=A0A917L1M4_9ACTN|nr:hypothetical protein GCM10012282_41420 [Streptomyces lacrimifluminis]
MYADFLERGLDLVEAVRLDDRGDELHTWLLTFCAEGWTGEWAGEWARERTEDGTGAPWPRTP